MPTVTVDALLDRFAVYRKAIDAMQNGHKADAAAWLNELARVIVDVVGKGTNGAGVAVKDAAQVEAILKAIDEEIAAAMREQAGLYQNAYGATHAAVAKTVPSIYADFGRSTVGRLNAARWFLTNQARKDFRPGFAKWAGRFNDAGGTLRAQMERELMNAQLYGWDQRTLAGRFLNIPEFHFKNLPAISERGRNIFTMGGRLGDADALTRRAHVIARTELNGVAERMHETWTTEAGFDRYINMNSDPVSELCKAANAKPPMTLKEWDQSGLGRPPRHPNCDSGLLAVPPESVDEVAAEIKARHKEPVASAT